MNNLENKAKYLEIESIRMREELKGLDIKDDLKHGIIMILIDKAISDLQSLKLEIISLNK